MKRLLAMLLTGCLLVQSLPGSAAVVLGAEADGVITVADDGGGAADASGGGGSGSDAWTAPYPEDVEELSSDGTAPVPGAEGNVSQDVPSDEEIPELLLPEEDVIDEIEMLPSSAETPEEETDEVAGIGQESESGEEPESEASLLEWELMQISEDEAQTTRTGEEGKGYVEVKVSSGLPFYPKNGLKLTIGLSRAGDENPWKVEEKILSAETKTATARFDETEPGEYTVTVNAPKFARYAQNITVNASRKVKLDISTSKSVNQTGAGSAVSGWLRLGDVTNGYTIEDEDIQVILAAIRGEETGSNFDANLNEGLEESEKVDIADLQIALESLYGTEQQSSVEEQQIPLEAAAEEGTSIIGSGKLEDLYSGGGEPVQLAPANGGDISPENPVAVSFTLASEGTPDSELPKVGGMAIKAPISTGQVEVTAVENGAEKILRIPMSEDTQLVSASMPVSAAWTEPEEGAVLAETVSAAAGEEALTPAEDSGSAAADADSADAEIMDSGIAVAAAEPAVEIQAPSVPQTIDLPVENVTGSSATVTQDGSLVLDFGRQVAVKKITIKITGTTKMEDKKLVDIAKVEFVNDMASRIPEPKMDIPTPTATASNEEITVSWNAQTNVTGYEVWISGTVKKAGQQEQTVRVSGTEHTFIGINENELMNFKEYKIKVRSVNGEWSSPWSGEITAVPKPTGRPDPVDNLKVESGYRSLRLSWKDMDDANGYMVYYKEKTSADGFKPVVEGFVITEPDPNDREKSGEGRIMTSSYTITGLADDTTYSVYVIGWNELGWGSYREDRIVDERTASVQFPQLPKYHAINAPEDDSAIGVVTPHIAGTSGGDYGTGTKSPRIIQSSLDKPGEKTAWGIVDNNYESYWTKYDWDDGVAYTSENKGVTVWLDDVYRMSYLTFSALDLQGDPNTVKIFYSNSKTGVPRTEVRSDILKKTDVNGNAFYLVRFQRAIEADKIQMCLGRTWSADFQMKVAEIRFYRCDDVYDDIMGLFADELHTSLKEGVTEEQLDSLAAALEAEDPVCKEKHPLYDSLKLELELAESLLKDSKSLSTIRVESGIRAGADALGFGGLNGWQPLGRVTAAGETLVVYVGNSERRTGELSDLRLVFTQYHAQSSALSMTGNNYRLKIGRNEITVPQISGENKERGGQVYVTYSGSSASDQYEVRVTGGVKIPVLKLYHTENRQEELERYVTELANYVKTIKDTHEKLLPADEAEKKTWKANVNFSYTEQNCFLNATDLMMEYMMYSVPALQVWSAITDGRSADAVLSGSEITAAAKKLGDSMDAMEKTMLLFYQHKGLSNDERAKERGNNALPVQHLNIRYMQMFSGAFMYASGDHIGVEYPETKMAGGAATWDGFGWGVAHEIGHDINQGTYAIAEITNNYFAQLLTKATSGTRFKYEEIYKKVTSGALGRSSSVGTQLGLYWQLHLAYDDFTAPRGGYAYADDRYIFDDYEEQFKNLFFARVDTYARNPDKAPNGLVLVGNADQDLMRLACAAAGKNILAFFERWGMVPDPDTVAYAGTFETETKALYYVNDDARDFRASHRNADGTINEAGSVKNQDVVTATVQASGSQVNVSIQSSAADPGAVLGYEIIRGMYSNGVLRDEVVGFQPASEGSVYTDTVATINNRVMYYKVRAVDKYLNYSNAAKAGHVKIETGGVLAKDEWSVETTMSSADDVAIAYGKDDPDAGYDATGKGNVAQGKVHSIDRVIDGDRDNAYVGNSGANARIVIDMHKRSGITSLKYKGDDLGVVEISVSEDESAWTKVKTVSLSSVGTGTDGFKTIWFDSVEEAKRSEWIGTYDARYVKLAFDHAGAVRINEIDVCGPTGDNLEFKAATDGSAVSQVLIGKLTADYTYSYGEDKTAGTGDDDVIPANSLVFTGTYKGNPAFNVVILYDGEGNLVGADKNKAEVNAEQVIFADVPEQGNLGETSDGTWLYYVKPEHWNDQTVSDIRAAGGIRGELYRVDDAQTLAGQRLVSDTEIIEMPAPDSLPPVTLTGGVIPAGQK